MASKLTDKAKELVARRVFASLATLDPDGRPQVTPLWVEMDGDDVLVNTARGRVKARNFEQDPRVGICIVDPESPYGGCVALQGTVVEATTDGADDHIDRLAYKYHGVDKYPNRRPGEVRLKVRIRVDHVAMQPE
ncbi:MAG: PPOX class F420-dependent oxidoreductase [Acidimicrobiales bacterium]